MPDKCKVTLCGAFAMLGLCIALAFGTDYTGGAGLAGVAAFLMFIGAAIQSNE